jgi:RNA polymerase sigma factor (sigma-70 family)
LVSTLTRTDSSDTASGGNNAARRPVFVTTHWSVVLTAGRADTPRARAAIETLCRTYWYPLYAYIRRRGYSPEDAQDLTQEFFARLLEKNALARVRREGGKFRSYLLTALNHFLVDEWKKARAQKRGAGRVLSLDAEEAETRFGREPADRLTPERLFEQNWAVALLNLVYGRLRLEYDGGGKTRLFEELKFCLAGERSSLPYSELAERLNLTESAVKVTVHRLRRRYRELLREEVAHTVASGDEIEDELRSLFRALAG